MKPTLNNDALPISSEINGILIKYCSALAEITKLNNDNARLREEIARLREVLADMVACAESQEWQNAELSNAVNILSNTSMSYPKERSE